MNKRVLFVLSACLLVSCGLITCSFLPPQKSEEQKNVVTETVMMQLLNQAHFSPKVLDDAFSENTFDLYIKRIDNTKKFLTQEDIEVLSKYRKQLDDEILSGKMDFFKESNKLLNTRMDQVKGWYKDLLAAPFEYSKDEKIETDPKKLHPAKNIAALKIEWQQLLKYQTLVRLSEMMDTQENIKAGKDTINKPKNFSEMEKESREKVSKTYDDFFRRMSQLDEVDRLGIFLGTISSVYDPHTEFFAPKVKENFDIAMSGQLEGIGAQLQERDGQIKVSNIVPGSPSWRQGQLKAGDVIMKVAQGSADAVDITNMPLDDAVQLIRGKKGTEVRLTVKKVDGSVIIIPIIRDVVVLEETYAKSLIIDTGGKTGYIKLPSFYADFNKAGGRRCAADMKKEILKLKSEGISGLIIDLRNNGGGSLQDVVDIAGLFIPEGPIVQVKSRGMRPDVLEDRDTSVLWRGPLVIMVNNISASASEILAAAMQDYNRGVIIGGEQTFGKGTVQRVLNLDDYLPMSDYNLRPVGSLKLTTQKFYRVNGETTQLKGVSSDISLSDRYEKLYKGEREEDFPLAWDRIEPSRYSKWSNGPDINKLKKKSEARIASNEAFNYIKELGDKYKKQSEQSLVSMNLESYRKEQKKDNGENEKLDKLAASLSTLKLSSSKEDMLKMPSDSTRKALHEDWLKSIHKDFYVREALEVVKDIQSER
jgi:carboxyl-terminal processing protease